MYCVGVWPANISKVRPRVPYCDRPTMHVEPLLRQLSGTTLAPEGVEKVIVKLASVYGESVCTPTHTPRTHAHSARKGRKARSALPHTDMRQHNTAASMGAASRRASTQREREATAQARKHY